MQAWVSRAEERRGDRAGNLRRADGREGLFLLAVHRFARIDATPPSYRRHSGAGAVPVSSVAPRAGREPRPYNGRQNAALHPVEEGLRPLPRTPSGASQAACSVRIAEIKFSAASRAASAENLSPLKKGSLTLVRSLPFACEVFTLRCCTLQAIVSVS